MNTNKGNRTSARIARVLTNFWHRFQIRVNSRNSRKKPFPIRVHPCPSVVKKVFNFAPTPSGTRFGFSFSPVHT